MSIFSRLFGRNKGNKEVRVGGFYDFINLIGVYSQATIASQQGITNLAYLPELRVFKQTLHVPTVNNKLGIGERTRCRKIIIETYGLGDDFFRQIDKSIKHRCRTPQDINTYKAQFAAFTQDLMMLMQNLMRWKLSMPSIFHKSLRKMTAKTIHDVMTRNDWNDASVARTVQSIRKYSQMLLLEEEWIVEYADTILTLAKKEPKTADNGDDKK